MYEKINPSIADALSRPFAEHGTTRSTSIFKDHQLVWELADGTVVRAVQNTTSTPRLVRDKCRMLGCELVNEYPTRYTIETARVCGNVAVLAFSLWGVKRGRDGELYLDSPYSIDGAIFDKEGQLATVNGTAILDRDDEHEVVASRGYDNLLPKLETLEDLAGLLASYPVPCPDTE